MNANIININAVKSQTSEGKLCWVISGANYPIDGTVLGFGISPMAEINTNLAEMNARRRGLNLPEFRLVKVG